MHLCLIRDPIGRSVVAVGTFSDWALVTISFFIPLLLMGLTLYLRAE